MGCDWIHMDTRQHTKHFIMIVIKQLILLVFYAILKQKIP